MTTAVDLITLALKDIGALGVGQPISPEDTMDALATLNMMLGQWQGERLSVYHLVDTAIQSTGAQSYTVGTGGDFNVPWAYTVNAAYARLSNGTANPIDYDLTIIKAREEYARIALKQLASFPSFAFYDSAWPLGNLIMYPVPNNTFELHIVTMQQLPQFATPADDVNLPPEYMAAIRYGLACYAAPSYQLEPTAALVRLAMNAKRVVKRMNVQIQSMRMPRSLMSKQRYNIYSDRPY
ncbi:packaged DNA stabilization gp4 family protein [Burkholderia gladioli]|uniref:packaged DNA stabilization gp4 family protein n=1 Tax=Burkholderia gladioli TaxID=28095 RepID=UPI001640FFFD|nr:packaged DNA stabilization gp4 family protein [Burkholderia gladioli]